jgi:hypothetical protein
MLYDTNLSKNLRNSNLLGFKSSPDIYPNECIAIHCESQIMIAQNFENYLIYVPGIEYLFENSLIWFVMEVY